MKKPPILILLLAAATVIPVVGQSQQESEQRVLATIGPSSATKLQVTAECSRTEPGTRVARFTWTVARTAGSKQRIDITPLRDGFRKAQKYETAVRVSGRASSAEWKGGDPGVNYYWRVLTLTPQGWVPSEIARYEAPICPVDFVPEQR